MKKVLLTFLIVICFGVISCRYDNSASNGSSLDRTEIPIIDPIDYGNEVYYFACTGRKFGASLSSFLSEKKKQVCAITSDVTGSDGQNIGYFVVLESSVK